MVGALLNGRIMAKTVYFSKTVTMDSEGKYEVYSLALDNTIPAGTHKITFAVTSGESGYTTGECLFYYNSWGSAVHVKYKPTSVLFPYTVEVTFDNDCSSFDWLMFNAFDFPSTDITIEIYDETDDTTDYKHPKYNMLVNGEM